MLYFLIIHTYTPLFVSYRRPTPAKFIEANSRGSRAGVASKPREPKLYTPCSSTSRSSKDDASKRQNRASNTTGGTTTFLSWPAAAPQAPNVAHPSATLITHSAHRAGFLTQTHQHRGRKPPQALVVGGTDGRRDGWMELEGEGTKNSSNRSLEKAQPLCAGTSLCSWKPTRRPWLPRAMGRGRKCSSPVANPGMRSRSSTCSTSDT